MASIPPPLLQIYDRRAIAGRSLVAAAAGDRRGRPWWTPLFRTVIGDGSEGEEEEKAAMEVEGSDERVAAARRSGMLLTAEKARALRREMRAAETWHDAMYHSPIASRLASPDQM